MTRTLFYFRTVSNVRSILEVTFSVSEHSHESFSIQTDKDSGGEDCGGSANNLSGRQLLAVAKTTLIQQEGHSCGS